MFTLQIRICLLISLTIISTVAQAEDAVELNMVVNRVTDSTTHEPSLNFQSVGIPNITQLTQWPRCHDFEMNPCPISATNIRYYEEVGQESLKCLNQSYCNNSVSLSDTMYLPLYQHTPERTTLTIGCKSPYRLQINESDYERNVKLIMERIYNPVSFQTTVTVDGVVNVTSYWNSSQQHRIRCVPDVSSTQPGITTVIGTKLTSILSVTSVTTTTDSNINGGGSGGQTGIKDKIGLIVGLTVSFLVLTVIITLLVILIRKRRQRKESPQIQESVYSGNSSVNHTVEEGDYNVLHQRIPQNIEQIYTDQDDNYQYSGVPDLQAARSSPPRGIEDRTTYHLVKFPSPTDNKNPRIHKPNDNYENTDTLQRSGKSGTTGVVLGPMGDVYSEVIKPSGGQEEPEIEMIENYVYEHAQTSDEEDCSYSLARDI